MVLVDCASVGTIMRPYIEKNSEWVEDRDFQYTPFNHHALISNETVFGGNSGGPVVCLEKNPWQNIVEKNDFYRLVFACIQF